MKYDTYEKHGITDIVCNIETDMNTGNHIVPPNCMIAYKIVDIEGHEDLKTERVYNVAGLTIHKEIKYESYISYDDDTDNYEISYDLKEEPLTCRVKVEKLSQKEEGELYPPKTYSYMECGKFSDIMKKR